MGGERKGKEGGVLSVVSETGEGGNGLAQLGNAFSWNAYDFGTGVRIWR